MEQDTNLTRARPALELSETQHFWLKHYEACQVTDQSLADYARAHGLAVKSFYYWKRRLRQLKAIGPEPQPPSPDPVFHAVRVQRTPLSTAACRLRFPNGMECDLTEIDEPGLERLLMTVSRLPL
jgi:transposase-like protein